MLSQHYSALTVYTGVLVFCAMFVALFGVQTSMLVHAQDGVMAVPQTCDVTGCAGVAAYASTELVACTMDAQVCPDGSYVGRVGPDCEFAPCPSEVAVCAGLSEEACHTNETCVAVYGPSLCSGDVCTADESFQACTRALPILPSEKIPADVLQHEGGSATQVDENTKQRLQSRDTHRTQLATRRMELRMELGVYMRNEDTTTALLSMDAQTRMEQYGQDVAEYMHAAVNHLEQIGGKIEALRAKLQSQGVDMSGVQSLCAGVEADCVSTAIAQSRSDIERLLATAYIMRTASDPRAGMEYVREAAHIARDSILFVREMLADTTQELRGMRITPVQVHSSK